MAEDRREAEGTVMRILGMVEPRVIEGADEVYPGMWAECQSGNCVMVWPAVTHDAVARESRIAMFFAWKEPATEADLKEAQECIDQLMGGPPDLVIYSADEQRDEKQLQDWLRTGAEPKQVVN